METLINSTINSFVYPKNHFFNARFHISSFSSPFIRTMKISSSTTRMPVLKCMSERGENGDLKDVLSGIVDARVQELLKKEENKDLLNGLEKASRRVEMAKKELAEIERQEIEAAQLRNYVDQLETRASEIEECQREISDARALVEEAERSLSMKSNGVGSGDVLAEKENEEIDKDEERFESVKAASVSALVGTLAGLPISLSQATGSIQLILPLAITFVSCALFGVTFRYTIRRDLDNMQLKTGTSAAFGFVKGLAVLGAGPPFELNIESFWSHVVDGAICVSENLFIFLFAAVSLDYCFKMRLLSPFPVIRQVRQGDGK